MLPHPHDYHYQFGFVPIPTGKFYSDPMVFPQLLLVFCSLQFPYIALGLPQICIMHTQ